MILSLPERCKGIEKQITSYKYHHDPFALLNNLSSHYVLLRCIWKAIGVTAGMVNIDLQYWKWPPGGGTFQDMCGL